MTTALRNIFAKPVDRPIDGVIKADDEASLRIELDEYVITDEIGRRLETFLDAYNNYDTANGVWISGFFGSGKSHLLKMLALLMENRAIDGVQAFDIFEEKLADQPMLLGALRKRQTSFLRLMWMHYSRCSRKSLMRPVDTMESSRISQNSSVNWMRTVSLDLSKRLTPRFQENNGNADGNKRYLNARILLLPMLRLVTTTRITMRTFLVSIELTHEFRSLTLLIRSKTG